jgi:hypothetical protein
MNAERKCLHSAAQMAASLPAVPCEECRAFIDRDGSSMSADVARQRYPMYRTSIDENQARWYPAVPSPLHSVLGASEQERKSNRNFLVVCAGILAVIAIVVWIVAFSHKPSAETAPERAASENCPSFSARANGECGSVQADEQAKHKEAVESEAHEAESVIKKRAAEENANAIEGTP